jgi:site-specific DNA-cytosine methylase
MKLATICTGGGIYEQGAIASGLTPIWGVEINPRVASVYKLNYPDSQILISDACDVDWNKLPMPDVLHASPSCRHFSTANNKTEAVKDIAVAQAVSKAIAHFLPEIFTLENVSAYQNSESWTVILNCLQYLGYSVSYQVHKLKYWGIPQKQRNRFIAIAIKSNEYQVKESPLSTLLLTPNRTRHWYEEIRDLIPTLKPSCLTNTQKNKLSPKTKAAIASGEIVLLKRNQIRDYTPAAYESDPYSWSITATLCKDHKDNDRKLFADLVTPDGIFSLNTRCLARIQTIPDSYKLLCEAACPQLLGVPFRAGNTAIDGLVIGDGVPCYFVQQMWEQILMSLEFGVRSSESNYKLITTNYKLKELRSARCGQVLSENIGAIAPLSELENIIKSRIDNLQDFYSVGSALIKIKTAKLYKPEFSNFYRYCSDRFSLSETSVKQLVRAVNIKDSVAEVVDKNNIPLIEAHCRSLAKIKDVEMRSLILDKVAKKGTITAKAIESEYRDMKVKAIAAKNNPELPGRGEVVRLTTKFKYDCLQYNGYWGVVCEVGEYSISVSVLDQIIYNLHPQDFIVIGDVEGASTLLSRLHAVSKSPDIDITVRELLKAIATNSYPELTKWQQKYLEFTEQELFLACEDKTPETFVLPAALKYQTVPQSQPLQ